MQVCPICKQAIKGDYPGADVYHEKCLMEDMKQTRERYQKLFGDVPTVKK